jgi:hypothetical protein
MSSPPPLTNRNLELGVGMASAGIQMTKFPCCSVTSDPDQGARENDQE